MRKQIKLIFLLDFHMIIVKMQKVNRFLELFFKSFLPHYPNYSKIARLHFKESARYFFSLIIAILIFGTVLSIVVSNPYSRWLHFVKTVSTVSSNFPRDFIIDLYKGQLSTNYNRPYFIWNQETLLGVIDRTAEKEKLKIYNSLILFSPKSIYLKNGVEIQNNLLSNFHLKLDKTDLQKISHSLNSFPFLFGVLLIVMSDFLILISKLIQLTIITFFISAVVFIFYSKILKKSHLLFPRIVQISFHSVTLPFLIYFTILVTFPIYVVPNSIMSILIALFSTVAVYEAYFEPKEYKAKPILHRRHSLARKKHKYV